MIKVKQTIVVIKKIWPEFTRDWMTNHLGKNPKNGGSPPRERKELKKQNFNKGELSFNEKA